VQIVARYFAALREIAGSEGETLDLPDGATVAVARSLIASLHPAAADLLEHCRAARNRAFADASDVLAEGDEIVFLPPMAGG
jgi:molybdopterin converting factor subunit 1